MHENSFPELTAKKAKLKIKTILTRSSAHLINSDRHGEHIHGTYVPKFFWLKEAVSYFDPFGISRHSLTVS